MNHFKLIFACATTLFAACTPKPTLTIINTSTLNFKDLAVVIPRQQVEEKVNYELRNQVVLAQLTNHDTLPCQFDDLDADGKWDEMVILLNMNGNEQINVVITPIATKALPQFIKRTNYRFARKNAPYDDVTEDQRLKTNDSPTISQIYQMEGPAWENDRVGFRNYYDARNGIDIFGKKTNRMALDSAGIRNQNYHEMDNWGMDILKVDKSLGAGAIAIGIGDSLYRVGSCDDGNVKLITEGSIRTIFEFKFNGVPAGNAKYDVRHQISIYAGDHFYRSKAWIINPMGNEKLVTGIVNKHNLPLITNETVNYKLFATQGAQAYTNEILGLGLIVPKSDYQVHHTSPMLGEGITETHLVELKAENNAPAEYCFFSGWEYQDDQFKDQNYLIEKMKEAANKLSATIIIK